MTSMFKALLADIRRKYNADQPRDDHGRWTNRDRVTTALNILQKLRSINKITPKLWAATTRATDPITGKRRNLTDRFSNRDALVRYILQAATANALARQGKAPPQKDGVPINQVSQPDWLQRFFNTSPLERWPLDQTIEDVARLMLNDTSSLTPGEWYSTIYYRCFRTHSPVTSSPPSGYDAPTNAVDPSFYNLWNGPVDPRVILANVPLAKGGPGSGNPSQPRNPQGEFTGTGGCNPNVGRRRRGATTDRCISTPEALKQRDAAWDRMRTDVKDVTDPVFDLIDKIAQNEHERYLRRDEYVRLVLQQATINALKRWGLPAPKQFGFPIDQAPIPDWLQTLFDSDDKERTSFNTTVNGVADIIRSERDSLTPGELYTGLYNRFFGKAPTLPSNWTMDSLLMNPYSPRFFELWQDFVDPRIFEPD